MKLLLLLRHLLHISLQLAHFGLEVELMEIAGFFLLADQLRDFAVDHIRCLYHNHVHGFFYFLLKFLHQGRVIKSAAGRLLHGAHGFQRLELLAGHDVLCWYFAVYRHFLNFVANL